MNVRQLKKQLEQLDNDEELYVEYWTKASVQIMEDIELTEDEWGRVVYEMEEEEGSSFFPTALRFNQKIEELTNAKLIERK